jgi:DNA-binding NtrC family response regulator
MLGLRLPDMDGRELVARIASDHPDTPAIVVTRIDDVEVAIDAMQRGAWDYVVKRPDHAHVATLPHVVSRAPRAAAARPRAQPLPRRDGSARDRASRHDGRGRDRGPGRARVVREPRARGGVETCRSRP